MFENKPLFVIKFLFFPHTVLVFEKLCFAENTIKIVLSAKHSFSKTQLVKPTFSQFFLVCTVLGPKHFLAKTDSARENALFFSLPDTNSVRQFLPKIHFLIFHIFAWPPQKTLFVLVFWPFPFSFFSFFCFYSQHKKDKNKKCNFLFENLIFDIPKILQKHYFGTVWHYLCFPKCPKNTIKLMKTAKKLDQFLTLDLDQF